MPLYEFSCPKCGHEFEELSSGNAAAPCPKCGARETEKLISRCARRPRSGSSQTSGGGCASCSGGNCAGCGH